MKTKKKTKSRAAVKTPRKKTVQTPRVTKQEVKQPVPSHKAHYVD